MKAPSEPCPVPNCALEWYLAASQLALSIAVWFISKHSELADVMQFEMFGKFAWSMLFGVAAIAQIASLSRKNQLAQRWSAFAGFLSALITLTIVISSFKLPLFTALIIPLALGEAYVFALLRGAKWGSSTR